MPYDPAFPPTDAVLVSAEFREQFNALKALVDAQAAQIAALEEANTALMARVEDLESGLAGTALNPSAVPPLSVSFSDPPTSGQSQQIVDGVNTLLGALQRV